MAPSDFGSSGAVSASLPPDLPIRHSAFVEVKHDLQSDRLHLRLHGHELYIPYTAAGFMALRELLMHQEGRPVKIGQRASLTQAQMDTLIRLWVPPRPQLTIDVEIDL